MYDYRRNQKQDKPSIFDQMKNLSSIAIVGTATFQYLKKTSRDIQTVEKANSDLLRRQRANTEDLAPLITEDRMKKWTEEQRPDIETIVKPGAPKQYDSWEFEGYDMFESEDFTPTDDKKIEQYIGEDISQEDLAKQASMDMATHSKSMEKLEKKYPGFAGVLAGPDVNMKIVTIKESTGYSRTFDMIVENTITKKRTKISLPNYTNGYIREGFREWIHSPSAILKDGKVIMPRFDKSFFNKFIPKLEKIMADSTNAKKDQVLVLRDYIDKSIGELFQREGMVLTSNSIMGISGYSFVNTDAARYMSDAAHDRVKRNEALQMANAWENKPVYLLTSNITGKEEDYLIDTGKRASFAGTSEGPYSAHGRMWTAPELGMGPGSDHIKQSTFRQNAVKGWKVKRSRGDWATKFGMVSSSLLDDLADEYTEDYTGRVSSVGFYFGEEKSIFDGAAVYVDQVVNNRPQARDFTGRYQEMHNLKFDATKKNNYHITNSLIDAYDKGEKEVRVTKGQILGINPANNKPITASFDGIITSIHIEKDNVKINISKNKHLTIGDKILQTKEVIEHIADNKSLKGFFLDGEDQEIAEHISRVDGKLGIEFLLNGSSIKRFMNGGVGFGFVNKVLSDVLELKKDEYRKLTTDSERAAYKEKMKSFAKDFINYQLGPEALAGIEEIHIDNDMKIGVVLHKQYSPKSDIFYKALDLEALIQQGEKRNDWKPFINKMEAIEKFINTHEAAKGIDYNVIRYAKDIRNMSKVNPTHISAFIMSGEKGNAGRLIHANLNMLLASHSVSNVNVASTAALRWNSRGFIGGSKISAEMRRNWAAMGMKGLTSYADYLMDYRMNYILDKTKHHDMFVLDSKRIKHGSTITIGDRKITANVTEFMLNADNDIMGRLQTEVHIGEELNMFHSIQLARNSLHNIQGITNTDLVEKVASMNLLTIPELTAIGNAGIGGNSIGFITKDLMETLVRTVNNSDPSSKGIYMKLPFEINFTGHIKGDMVSLINFDKEDAFEVVKATYMEQDGRPAGARMRDQFYTVGGMQFEYLDYMKKVAEVTREYNNGNISEDKRNALKAKLEHDTKLLFDNVRKLTGDKGSSYTQAIHNGKAPLSTRGEVKGAIGLKLGEVGMTPDAITSLLTGDQTKTFKDLSAKVKVMEELTRFRKDPELFIKRLEQSNSINQKSVRQILTNYKSSLDKLAGSLPESKILSDNINELTDIMDRGIRELGGKSKTGKLEDVIKRIRKDSISNIDAIIKELKPEHINNSNALATIRAIERGDADIHVIGERFPIKGPGAQAFWKLKIYKPEGVDEKRYVENAIKKAALSGVTSQEDLAFVRERAIEQARRVHSYLYLNQADTLGISGDNDKDFISVMMTSFDTIQDIHTRNMRMMGLNDREIKQHINTDLRAQMFTPPNSRDITNDTLRGYIERLTVIEAPDDRNFRPANAQSSIILDVINNAKYLKKDGPIETIDLKRGIESVVDKSYPFKTKLERSRIVDGLVKEATAKANSMYTEGAFGSHGEKLKFITDINYINNINDNIKKADNNPAINPVKIIDTSVTGLTDEQVKAHEESSLHSKKRRNQYDRDIQEKYVNRFGEMKVDTPTAYKLGENINRLAENATFSESEKTFMFNLADRIAQTTISTKHGTPSYLDYYKKAIQKLEKSNYKDNAIIEELTTGNVELELPGFKKEMYRYGFLKTVEDNIDFDTFQNYLEEKTKLGDELRKAHESALNEKITNLKRGYSGKELIEKYKSRIDSHMANVTINGIHTKVNGVDVFEDWMYSAETSNRAILQWNEEKKNAKVARDAISGYSKEEWERLSYRLKVAKKSTGFSLLQDPYEQVRERLKSEVGDANATFQIENMYNNLRYADRLDFVMDNVHSSQASLVKVMAANYRAEAKIRMGNVSEERRIGEKLHSSQTSHIRREIFVRDKAKPTIFYQGSILEGLAGKSHKPAMSTPEGIEMANRGGAIKLKSIVAGALAGIFIGESINMLTGDGAIPGLGRTQGLGGEYFEHKGMFGADFMGREMEGMLREKPVKLASEWSHWNADLKYQQGVSNIRDSEIRRDNPRYTPSYKGVMVR